MLPSPYSMRVPPSPEEYREGPGANLSPATYPLPPHPSTFQLPLPSYYPEPAYQVPFPLFSPPSVDDFGPSRRSLPVPLPPYNAYYPQTREIYPPVPYRTDYPSPRPSNAGSRSGSAISRSSSTSDLQGMGRRYSTLGHYECEMEDLGMRRTTEAAVSDERTVTPSQHLQHRRSVV